MVAAISMTAPAGEVRLNASIGVALLAPGSAADWQALLKQAALALYPAKARGRNRVVLHEEDEIAPPNPASAARARSYPARKNRQVCRQRPPRAAAPPFW